MKAQCLQGLSTLAARLVIWQRQHGRHHLPWQGTTDPYRIWLSEIMLQQTQVTTVIGYYERFLQRFPSIADLAQAHQDEVMPYWAGLGYYARARHLHRCAQIVQTEHNGQFPGTAAELATLPGIGPSTAAAIAAFAYGEHSPIMDGNVKRVFTRHFGVAGDPNQRAVEKHLWDIAHDALKNAPEDLDIRSYTQGLMDLGATLCTRRNPDCLKCPVQTSCYAHHHGLQHALPQPRVRKTQPSRQCTMLVLEHQNHVLLQQQPSPGIWGGLWSLPQFDDTDTLDAALTNWQIRPVHSAALEPLVHTFSHFRLHIQPQHIIASSTTSRLSDMDAAHQWTPVDALGQTALPAPVKSLLDAVFVST